MGSCDPDNHNQYRRICLAKKFIGFLLLDNHYV